MDKRPNTKKNFDDVVKERKKNKRKSAVAAVLMAVVLVIVGVYYCFANLFVYKTLKLESAKDGQECPYTVQEVEKQLGLKKETGLFDIDEEQLQNKIKYNLPYIKSAEISKQIPSTIKLKMEYEKPTYYIEVGGDLYILSNNLRVLEKTKDIEKIEINARVLLELSDVRNCIEGEELGVAKETKNTLSLLVKTLKENDVFEKVSRIDLTNQFDINLICTSKFSVKLGDKSNLKTKVLLMKTVMKDKESSNDGGIIDVSDEAAREAIFRRYG